MAAALSRTLPHALTGPDKRPRPKVVGAVGPVGRARAVELLAAGHTDSAVGHALAVDRGTVRRWRGEPDVAEALARARREREAAGAEALDDARRILAEAAPRAAQALVDALEDADPRVSLAGSGTERTLRACDGRRGSAKERTPYAREHTYRARGEGVGAGVVQVRSLRALLAALVWGAARGRGSFDTYARA